ncbi:MAG TPA: T9SS type A sorting domain-containing protein [bacterium]|nr:T9SS type A sorting domain-containing protein [bacterium]
MSTSNQRAGVNCQLFAVIVVLLAGVAPMNGYAQNTAPYFLELPEIVVTAGCTDSFDLWDYAEDAESSDDQLMFSLSECNPGNCCWASLNPFGIGHMIDIVPPVIISGCIPYECHMTVRVYDGDLSDEATLHVTILPNDSPQPVTVLGVPEAVCGGQGYDLSASVSAPCEVSWHWTTNPSGIGTFSAPSSNVTRWTPPAGFTGDCAVIARAETDCWGANGGEWTIVGGPPGIPSITGLPGTVEAGQIYSLSASAPGNPTGWSWSSSCGGSFNPPDNSSTIWTAPSGFCGPCDIGLTATAPCGSTSNSQSTSVSSGPLPQPDAPLLMSPFNGISTTDGNPYFDWSDVSPGPGCILTYMIEVSGSNGFYSIERSASDLSASNWDADQWPAFSFGDWYWRVRARNQRSDAPSCAIWGNWSEVRWFWVEKPYSPPPPSCPVLFVLGESGYAEENPLLTACERFGYTQEVTDLYPITAPVPRDQERLTLQLRELEDEVTYLRDLEIMVVDHSSGTLMACDPEGNVRLCESVGQPPMSAIDEDGNDRLSELVTFDDSYYEAPQSGSLVLTYGAHQGAIFLPAAAKDRCHPVEKVASNSTRSKPELTVELLTSDGLWSPSAALPPRENPSSRFVVPGFSASSTDLVTYRVSWLGPYAVNSVPYHILVQEEPMVQLVRASSVSVLRGSQQEEPVDQGSDPSAMVLHKGDIATFEFELPGLTDPGMKRDFVVKAVGRYEPVLRTATDEMPTAFRLHENFPNPFNAGTVISFDLSENSDWDLTIYNVLGQPIRQFEGRGDEGQVRLTWDGRNGFGSLAASGVYLYRLEANGHSSTKKMMLLR